MSAVKRKRKNTGLDLERWEALAEMVSPKGEAHLPGDQLEHLTKVVHAAFEYEEVCSRSNATVGEVGRAESALLRAVRAAKGVQ